MSDIIHLLPDSVANQIAAGEVIQRPASVVKELVENALDAGATHIDVIVLDAGRTCIQVIDNGKGMSESDARLSFERHATSKIQSASDLFALNTMGFRGEALASIAAVAQVELKTRQKGQDLGTQITIEGSKFTGQEVVSCPEGCNFSVKNLFFNIPVRRKFLKSNATELSNILVEFERIVLVNPECGFSFYNNGVEMYDLPPCGIKQRVCDVFGKKFSQQLLSIDVETSLGRISGFVGKPETSKKKGLRQFFFVNGRFMKHPYFHKAVMEAYDQLIPTGEQVNYFIYFNVAPAEIDVNIHPTKTEIKFENEQTMWPILMAAVKESLGKFNAVPTIEFDTVDKPEIPAFGTLEGFKMPELKYNPSFNPFTSSKKPIAERSNNDSNTRDWELLYKGVEKEEQNLFFASNEAQDDKDVDSQLSYIQYKGQYIVSQIRSGLMVIHQQRAHLCVLFHRYMQNLKNHKGQSQGQLFPEVIQLSASESVLLEKSISQFTAIGFDLASLGSGSYSVNGVPAGTENLQPVTLLKNMIASLQETDINVVEKQQEVLALSLAKMAVMPLGQILNQKEMGDLVGNLLVLPTPNYTPDGKTVIKIIEEAELNKMF